LDKGEGQAKSNDGMDMTLLKIENSTGRVSFAGAGHSLHVNTKDGLAEVNGDLFPVGYFYGKEKPFTSKELSLAKGDCLYLTSDGYSDQFGGEKNKKLGYGRFKQLIEENGAKSMEEQKEAFESAFNKWKDGNAQIDDVCVMGIRIQ
jgi:serine phosphatase RsbU (regulator of sigma subunit)